jgi:hypothetical protein
MIKHSLLFLLFVVAAFCRMPAAAAQENYYNPSLQEENRPVADKNTDAQKPAADIKIPDAEQQEPAAANSFTVTSIQKCYAQLKHEDALEIQKNYIKPYEECQRRLAQKLKNEQEKKPGSAGAPDKKTRNFYSIFQRNAAPEKNTDKGEVRKGEVFQERVPLQ